jgi:hypothetical protein
MRVPARYLVPSALQRLSLWLGLGLLLVLVRSPSRPKPPEPMVGGKRLSQILYSDAPDFEWMPNDFYGHVHDELWYALTTPASDKAPGSWTNRAAPEAEPAIGTNAIPCLLRWMQARPTTWDRIRDRVAGRLPSKLAFLMDPYLLGGWKSRAGRWQIAACKGFEHLGTNAEPALPALSNLLYTTTVDLPLTSAIASVGPRGLAVLTNALVATNLALRDNAALSLGMCAEGARLALPALVDCVERGQAGYRVLGAIGRIGGRDPRLVPALVRLLEYNPIPAGMVLDEDMAILVLGLQGRKAQPAVPALLARYHALPDGGTWPRRRLVRRVLKIVSPETEAQLPPPTQDELREDWP